MLLKIATLISRLSFRNLYRLSDFIYVVLYHIIGYRKGVVRNNLSSSFPEKSEMELRDIEKKFYHWLCDYIVETIKLLTITPEEMKQHMEYKGLDEIVAALKPGHGISAFLGHYCNWEWLSSARLFWPDEWENMELGLIYHALRNDDFDELMLKARSSLGGVCVNKRKILRELVKCKGNGYLFGYIFDQSPKWDSIHLWLNFLNHNTPVFTGAERIARKMDDLVVFVSVERPERGRYVATFNVVTDKPNEMEEFEITRKCFAMLEESIRKQPEFYLWTHNRWKRTYEEYLEMEKEKKDENK